MPEYNESLISLILLLLWMLWMILTGGSLEVLNIWIDATDSEQTAFPVGHPAKMGHVYAINDTCNVVRGQRNSQHPIYPPMYSWSGVSLHDCGLQLQDVVFAARNVILNLGSVWVQVNMNLCIGIQLY